MGFNPVFKNGKRKLGDWATEDIDHDLLVGLESSQNVEIWTERNPKPKRCSPIECHHLNYLVTTAGQNEVKRLLFIDQAELSPLNSEEEE